MNSFKGNVSFFKGWLNFSSLKVLELLPAKARHNFFEILKLYIKLYIVQAEKQTMMQRIYFHRARFMPLSGYLAGAAKCTMHTP